MKFTKPMDNGEYMTVDTENDSGFSLLLYMFTDYKAECDAAGKKFTIGGWIKDFFSVVPIWLIITCILLIPIMIFLGMAAYAMKAEDLK